VIGLPTMIGCNLGSGTPVGVALSAVKDATEVLTKRPDGCAVLRIRVAVSNPDDHGPDRPSILARWWKHRGCKPVSVLVAKSEEHGHDALKVGLQPDVPLDVGPGGRHIGRDGVFTRLPKMLLDRVLHQIGFQGRFRLGLDLKPRLSIRGVAYVAHDPAHL
jgi:hypothetical protein